MDRFRPGLICLVPLLLLVIPAAAWAGSKENRAFDEAFWAYDTSAMEVLLAKQPKLIQRAPGAARVTTLHAAVGARDVPMVGFLMRHGADLEAADSDGARALHFAARGGQDSTGSLVAARREVQEMLLTAGARVTATDSWGATPLHWAAMHADPDFIALLIQHGADVNFRTPREGMTPLHAAADGGDTSIVRMLLEHGAAPGVRDRAGRSPLDVARLAKHPEVADLLASHDAAR